MPVGSAIDIRRDLEPKRIAVTECGDHCLSEAGRKKGSTICYLSLDAVVMMAFGLFSVPAPSPASVDGGVFSLGRC
jgi:hypothetical protein